MPSGPSTFFSRRAHRLWPHVLLRIAQAQPCFPSTVRAYVAVSRASQDAMLFTDNAAQLGPQLAVETSKTAVSDAEQVTSIANAVGMSR